MYVCARVCSVPSPPFVTRRIAFAQSTPRRQRSCACIRTAGASAAASAHALEQEKSNTKLTSYAHVHVVCMPYIIASRVLTKHVRICIHDVRVSQGQGILRVHVSSIHVVLLLVQL